MNTTVLRSHSDEIRLTYVGAVPHTIFTALVWITSGLLGIVLTKATAILFFIIAGSFVFPGGELIRKWMGTPNQVSKDNKLPIFFTLLAFTIPLSYPLIYFVCRDNINLFFPAFTILVGAHYLPFVYGYRMITFAVLSILLVAAGTYSGLYLSHSFSAQAFITGGILLGFSIIHFVKIKKEYSYE